MPRSPDRLTSAPAESAPRSGDEARAGRSAGIVALATWFFSSVVYFHLLVIYADWPARAAAAVAAITVGVATVLGVPIWWLSGRLTWPARWALLFLGAHFAMAVAFSAAWLAIDIGITHALLEDEIFRRKLHSMNWEALLGLWVYGLIAGVSYAIRARRDADAQRRVAERASAIAAQAQLAALRSQLNPHFLFNALHSLGALARRDLARLDDALERLGDLLRHALDPASAGCVPFADDLAFAENYLAIERLRLGDRLRVELDVDPEALDIEVPFLTLQPLVENAILHGIGSIAEGGTIRIQVATRDDGLLIVVTDDGAGPSATNDEKQAGIGLGALRERLALTYDRFELVCGPGAGGGYEVRVAIPAR
jgi:two-component system, LytTR family, sensor kinase